MERYGTFYKAGCSEFQPAVNRARMDLWRREEVPSEVNETLDMGKDVEGSRSNLHGQHGDSSVDYSHSETSKSRSSPRHLAQWRMLHWSRHMQ